MRGWCHWAAPNVNARRCGDAGVLRLVHHGGEKAVNGNPEPRGLHRRIEARERRLAMLEAELLALQSGFASSSSATHGGGEALAESMAHTQEAYDDALIELRDLHSLARRLRDWGLSPEDTASWASVCRALGLPAPGGAHRTLRTREPVLHVLLHRCALPPHCSIDAANYRC